VKGWLEERDIVRILCLAERPDNLLMWSHYAKSHSGVVLAFKTEPFERSCSSEAMTVSYSTTVPTPFTYEKIRAWLLGAAPFPNIDRYTREVVCTKGRDWSYEQEWRFMKYGELGSSEHHSLIAFPSDTLVGLYYGCKIDSSERERLTCIEDPRI
jgi:hypothetical protein